MIKKQTTLRLYYIDRLQIFAVNDEFKTKADHK